MAVLQNLTVKIQKRPLLLLHILMMFLCITNFDIMRNLKESLLVTRLGAEIIPFVKFWIVMPSALLFLVIYSFLANRLNKRHLFIVVLIPFLIWMPLFAHVLHPNLDILALDGLAISLEQRLPDHLQFIAGLIQFWPLTLFFALAELWGSGVLCVLFWTMLNDSYNSQSAAETYPIITMTGNTASLLSGPLLIYCVSTYTSSEPKGWQDSLILISTLFVIFGLAMLVIHEYCCFKSNRHLPSTLSTRTPDKTTTHLSFMQSVKYLARSPYLASVALVVLSYCIAINMVEVAWKSQLLRRYPSEAEYSIIMSKLTFLTGIGCIICGFLNARLLKRSWFGAAIAPLVIMACTAIPFFILTIVSETQNSAFDLLMAGIFIGGLSNVLSKSAKYTFFDTTKELSFVPLDSEQKYKGKAAIELIVSRLGKSGSAFFQQFLILTLGSLSGAIPWLAGAFMLVVCLWFFSVKQLNNYYLSLTKSSLIIGKHTTAHNKNTISLRN